jgi:hypothetical protein
MHIIMHADDLDLDEDLVRKALQETGARSKT